ncbi:MAG: D-lyxose/D-mannose family sugar isomerase [Spirochaetales bacterium]|nr:D-lyxose/D-mannose family sugar isomerase [Spirochaetales bacterium]
MKECAKLLTISFFDKAGIIISEKEKEDIEVADFGLNDLMSTGLQLVVYINSKRTCSKEMVLFPGQTCPEHKHPSLNGQSGKEETFRCRWGTVYLYVPGEPAGKPTCKHPSGLYTVQKEIVLKPGEQFTIKPETLHWFQAGPEGAVVSEFSTSSHDESDIFTDPSILRAPEVSGK